MRIWLTCAAATLQLFVLAFMAAQREHVIHFGESVCLRSAPIDPRDLFRGDYVRLNYEASAIPRNQWRGGLVSASAKRGTKVYASLATGTDGLGTVTEISDERPDDGLFIRGRVQCHYSHTVTVRYGLEAYFMQQDTALALEKERSRDGIQVPLEMDVAVGRNGIAVLRGHRWSPVGLGIELVQTEEVERQRRRQQWSGEVVLRLLNSSQKELAIVDLPEGRSFVLQPQAQWTDNPWQWVRADDPPPAVRDEHVRVLAPGEIHTMRYDMRASEWFVAKPHTPARSVHGLEDWNHWFRLVYRPPSAEACAHLSRADILWHGTLPSRRFNGRNRVD